MNKENDWDHMTEASMEEGSIKKVSREEIVINSVADLAGTVLPLLLFYQATMGPRTLVSPGERHS